MRSAFTRWRISLAENWHRLSGDIRSSIRRLDPAGIAQGGPRVLSTSASVA
jgi:hypothetical protein